MCLPFTVVDGCMHSVFGHCAVYLRYTLSPVSLLLQAFMGASPLSIWGQGTKKRQKQGPMTSAMVLWMQMVYRSTVRELTV